MRKKTVGLTNIKIRLYDQIYNEKCMECYCTFMAQCYYYSLADLTTQFLGTNPKPFVCYLPEVIFCRYLYIINNALRNKMSLSVVYFYPIPCSNVAPRV